MKMKRSGGKPLQPTARRWCHTCGRGCRGTIGVVGNPLRQCVRCFITWLKGRR